MRNKIPEQEIGGKSDTVSEIEFPNELQAKQHFELVKKRFLDINSWELIAGKEKAEFSLRDEKENLILQKPKVGNYIRIKVPGLHNDSGDGYDWVRIEALEEEKEENTESIYIRVRPNSNPLNPTEETCHFFDSRATSNFLITREGTKISAEVHGRNEVPNINNDSILDKVRNSLVAIGGIIAGSKFQWKSFTDGLIKDEK